METCIASPLGTQDTGSHGALQLGVCSSWNPFLLPFPGMLQRRPGADFRGGQAAGVAAVQDRVLGTQRSEQAIAKLSPQLGAARAPDLGGWAGISAD
jgi:hypothetical protein